MSASTTLMTFQVRTPPTTRSVTLYGSWDNFCVAYPMARDVRRGPEHWSGCHSFENIICDGDVSGLGVSRSGGLKMGGTYWYYYQLDDEIEFHNSAEPSTTRCPLLPGQLVNVLQVPFSLSTSRKRDASVSSTSSERRTMDPEAKFMNPRPVPPRPQFVRLNSSPSHLQGFETRSSPGGPASATPFLGAEVEDDFSSNPSRVFLLPRKSSLDALVKVASSKTNPAGLRRPFRAVSRDGATLDGTGYQEIVNWNPGRLTDRECQAATHRSRSPSPASASQSRGGRPRPPPGTLLLRSHSDEAITLSSFGEHRRQQSRSRSRGGSSRNSMVFDDNAHLDLGLTKVTEPAPLSTLLEVNSPEQTPGHGPRTGRRMALEALEGRSEEDLRLEKRLPTLPNTPSSAYPPSHKGNSPPRNMADAMVELDSRFSATTIDTTCHLNSIIMDERYSQLPDWATTLEKSPVSETTLDDGFDSPTLPDEYTLPTLRPLSSRTCEESEVVDGEDCRAPRIMSSKVSCTTISSTVSTTPSTSYGDHDIIEVCSFVNSNPTRISEAHMKPFQHYKLPEYENASEITLKQFNTSNHSLASDQNISVEDQAADRTSGITHSEGMRQLLEELSYLSGLIQH